MEYRREIVLWDASSGVELRCRRAGSLLPLRPPHPNLEVDEGVSGALGSPVLSGSGRTVE
jgi:hypothetical protein